MNGWLAATMRALAPKPELFSRGLRSRFRRRRVG